MNIVHPVFVILPLSSPAHTQRFFDEGIAPALARYGFEARRVDDQAVRGGIIDTIQRQIRQSYFLIADLSFERPNCYYEVGYAQALGKPVLLCAAKGTEVHFNIANHQIHSFDDSITVGELVAEQIPRFLETSARHPDDDRNGKFGRRCIRDGFRLTAKIDECTSNRCVTTFEVCAIDTEREYGGLVKFYMHRTYEKSVQQIKLKNGVARYEEVLANGPWTLGAEVVETRTRLELDLATIPGAKDWWYRRAYAEV